MTTKHEYPLWCVDNGEHTDTQRYKGPFATRMQANTVANASGEKVLVRRHRQDLAAPQKALTL